MSRQLLPTTVFHLSTVPLLTVTHSRMVVLSPMTASVSSPTNLRSWGTALMTAPGKMLHFLPMRAPSMMMAWDMMWVPSPISTFSVTTAKASMVTLGPILALGCTWANGLIMLLRAFYNLSYQVCFSD